VRGTQVAEFGEVIADGGLAIFPTDTVYGLGTHPDSVEGAHRLYWVKGRAPDRPAAVLFFDLERAIAALPELGPKTREALGRLLPGPVTVLVPNPGTRFPLACGAEPDRLGIRVPALNDRLAQLADVTAPILQSSANPTGEPDPRSLDEIEPRIRRGADLELDAGILPGTPSTVIDLSRYEKTGEYEVLREGALSDGEVAELVASS
jgi:L-threonylcarbamoyladenylate synthase